MDYTLYKLEFTGGVHFGRHLLEDADISFQADTLFSALCQEAVKEQCLEKFLSMARAGELLISDAFPYMGSQYFLPKPFLWIKPGEERGDSTEKKKLKKMQYLPAEYLDAYCQGAFPIDKMEDLSDLGNFQMKVSVSIRGQEEPKPYRVQYYCFKEGNGLYFLLGAKEKEGKALFDELMASLSYSGLGGKRSSGLGRFECRAFPVPDALLRGLARKGSRYMLLSCALPRDEELDQAVEGADYQLVKRSGFVASADYAPQQMRKRDLYVFHSGSCFRQPFQGDIWDVSAGGNHPVYRYGKGLFMGVTV